MRRFGELDTKHAANTRALAVFGAKATDSGAGTISTIRQGTRVTLYTVGYERRDAEELMAVLIDQGIKALADVRERPMSRKPDFRAGVLRQYCQEAGIKYQPWPMLGSTVDQRDALKESGDFRAFERRFRVHARKTMTDDLKRLAESVKRVATALLCYERLHEDCHRSVIAELVAEQINATVVAIQ